MKILITCPPMLGKMDLFKSKFEEKNIKLTLPLVSQTLDENQLLKLVPAHDGWIIGDDKATHKLLNIAKSGNLKAIVKWGVGIDNVDTMVCNKLRIKFQNTPNMFGKEVSDIVVGYVIGLARETFSIDREVRLGNWYKPCGISLYNKKVAILGYGDIGKNTAKRLRSLDMDVSIYDPNLKKYQIPKYFSYEIWPKNLNKFDFIVITCSLTEDTYHMINDETIEHLKDGVRIVNVSRGHIINEKSLINGLKTGKIHSVALDVFEEEPLKPSSYFLRNKKCILGTHNSSNTVEAVTKTSEIAINKLFNLLGI